MDTVPFYFTWKGFKIGNYFPMYVEPTLEKQFEDGEGGEQINHPLIRVDVPADPIYLDISTCAILTVEGAKFCRKELEKIFVDAPPTHDEWDLSQASKAADDNVVDEFWNN